MFVFLKSLRPIRTFKLIPALLTFAALAEGSAAQTSYRFDFEQPLLTQKVTQSNQGDRTLYYRAKDWFVKCDYSAPQSSQSCQLASRIQFEDDVPALPYSFTIYKSDDYGNPVAILRTPLNLHLSMGVGITIDQRSIGKLNYRSCDENGCTVLFSMTSSIANAMVKGLKMSFEVHQLSGESQTASFSLLGISNVLNVASSFLRI